MIPSERILPIETTQQDVNPPSLVEVASSRGMVEQEPPNHPLPGFGTNSYITDPIEAVAEELGRPCFPLEMRKYVQPLQEVTYPIPSKAEIEFALKLDFDRRPRLTRSGENEVVLNPSLKQPNSISP